MALQLEAGGGALGCRAVEARQGTTVLHVETAATHAGPASLPSTRHTVPDLPPATPYCVWVAGENAAGKGEWSAPLACRTQPAGPSPPQALAVESGAHFGRVAWSWWGNHLFLV